MANFVDQDKLLEKIDGIWDCNDMVFKPDDHCCNIPEDCKGCKWRQTKNALREMIEKAPKEDVAPVAEIEKIIESLQEQADIYDARAKELLVDEDGQVSQYTWAVSLRETYRRVIKTLDDLIS